MPYAKNAFKNYNPYDLDKAKKQEEQAAKLFKSAKTKVGLERAMKLKNNALAIRRMHAAYHK
jgi:hypothetical protein